MLPFVYTRVNVAAGANEWVATASGSGSLTLTDTGGNTCTGGAFSWSIFPEQAK